LQLCLVVLLLVVSLASVEFDVVAKRDFVLPPRDQLFCYSLIKFILLERSKVDRCLTGHVAHSAALRTFNDAVAATSRAIV